MICNRTKNLQHLITFYDKTKLDLLNLFQFTIKIIFVTFKLVEVYFIWCAKYQMMNIINSKKGQTLLR